MRGFRIKKITTNLESEPKVRIGYVPQRRLLGLFWVNIDPSSSWCHCRTAAAARARIKKHLDHRARGAYMTVEHLEVEDA